ncbi:L,D-transpeptidase [Olivibacter sitiensis]|uniref:L,D-transpeptidase n=1 Tax=Olivibacter sitiensis TaxID=376470 RepID=UPI0003F5042B|nr:L,D-transpeptidase [Olivibacter sitiensis]
MKKRNIILFCIFFAVLGLFLESCRSDKQKDETVTEDGQPDPLDSISVVEKYDGGYRTIAVKGNDSLTNVFDNRYTDEQRYVILALNRLDGYRYRSVDSLVVPDSTWSDIKSYSPFPSELETLKDVNKIVIFSYPLQAFAAYVHGKLLRWGPTSMGRKDAQTPTGLHFANWKKEEHISTVDDEWLLKWNFNIMNKEGVGWHLYALPGIPASHSCLRLLEEDAKYLYSFADMWLIEGTDNILAQGTPVLVYGAYDFEGRKPWMALAGNPKANDISVDELNQELQPHIAKILEEQKKRETVEKESTSDAS